MRLTDAEAFILPKLRSELSDTLYYHSLHHTLDVMESVIRIAGAEGISDSETLTLLRTGALFHDTGFLFTYQGHENESCRLARELLPGFGYSMPQIDTICGMIEATKIPQNPKNKLEEIICDADLDYLGRDDFEAIAGCLYRELKARDRVADERAWNAIQIKFLENHRYRTPTGRALRQPGKLIHLQKLRDTMT
ncbi:HD domain-containing protein [Salmonirosea aquatica]|uniref:HD domain-containing protein n=1 Tax=Salmonirosea aquatica TaxID=2654236 RepID=A0A7C9BES3_9BACT|nr:HD domain-containing protein [Cytophagaceae bacterium SJW1-29]